MVGINSVHRLEHGQYLFGFFDWPTIDRNMGITSERINCLRKLIMSNRLTEQSNTNTGQHRDGKE